MTEPSYVSLTVRVPTPLVPRLSAALRATYPTITEGLADGPAARAVIRFWMASTLTAYEGEAAESELPAAIEAARQEYAAAGEAARTQATTDAATILT